MNVVRASGGRQPLDQASVVTVSYW